MERSLLMVKPDGIEKGLRPHIRSLLRSAGLTILREEVFQFTPELARTFYNEYSQRDYFSQLIEFISSRPVVIFLVAGSDAVGKVRQIIGKRQPPSGLRERWAESIIRNVAHGPDSQTAAQREIELIFGKEAHWMLRRVFLIGGMSESGKSTVGRYLDSRGIKRLKIVTYLQRVMEKEGAQGDFQAWNNQAEHERSEWLMGRFVEEFLLATESEGIAYCCLESLYRPEFGQFVRDSLGAKVVVVYVEIPLEIRLQRQVIRQDLSSVNEAKDYLLPRDQKKEEWGVPRIRDIADVVIDNSGTLENLYRQVDAMIARYCPELSGQ